MVLFSNSGLSSTFFQLTITINSNAIIKDFYYVDFSLVSEGNFVVIMDLDSTSL